MKLPSKRKLIPIAAVILVVVVAGIWLLIQGRGAQQLIESGNAALQAKDWNKASEMFSQAKLRAPNDPAVVYGLAKADVELALQDYRGGRPGYVNRLRK